ncbi:MAG: hypothetical protein II782_02115 [Oscillospiraceae bacterium]|nr:hypothetical protein [Oscillospiraceae bacterium]MBQ4487545.1 hypothetical protein [Oscillospiraceae bacterium]
MEPNDLCVVRIAFDNLEDLRECLNVMISQKLIAYAVAQRVGTYRLEMTADEDNITGYKIDENIFGSISADQRDDILLEVYTNKRLAGKIGDIIEANDDAAYDNYIIIPILSASRKIRVSVRNLMMYHQKLDSTDR